MDTSKNERIFISYKRVDKDRVFELKNEIEQSTGEKCWIDLDGIESDAQFADVIISAINRCEVFLFMYSASHTKIVNRKKDWTIREISFAEKKDKRIVFVNIDNSPLTDWFELNFGTTQQVDATDTERLRHLYNDLCAWLKIDIRKNQQDSSKDASKAEQDRLRKEKELQERMAQAEAENKQSNSTNSKDANKSFTVNGVSFKMIAIEGGSFTMGATSEQGTIAPSNDEKPTHYVTLSDYMIGETEITQELWQAVMGSNPSKFKDAQSPVDSVSWKICQTFIKKLNQLTNMKFRLPTEAEWEFAARGGNMSKGYKYAGSNNLDDVAWTLDNIGICKKPRPVKLKQANELGIYDMSGNVLEWCQDKYGNYKSKAQTNPTGPYFGSLHVIRGGAAIGPLTHCRVSARWFAGIDYSSRDIGLRLAL